MEAPPEFSGQHLEVAGVPLLIRARKRDAEVLSGRSDLTGHVLWSATELLAALVVKTKAKFRDARVVELGCGTGLAGVTAAQYAALTVFTDKDDAVLDMALHNALANGAHRLGDAEGRQVACGALEWGNLAAAEALCGAHGGGFDFCLMGELFYILFDSEVGVEASATLLFSTAKSLLGSSGVAVFVYTPRYRGMAAALDAAAAACSMKLRTVNRDAALTDPMRDSLRFGRVRLGCVSVCEHALAAFTEDLLEGGPSDYDESDSEDEDPLSAFGVVDDTA